MTEQQLPIARLREHPAWVKVVITGANKEGGAAGSGDIVRADDATVYAERSEAGEYTIRFDKRRWKPPEAWKAWCGDRIKLAHDALLVGLSWGRVKALQMEIIGYTDAYPPVPIYGSGLAGVVLDEPCPMTEGLDYGIRFGLQDNSRLF